MGGTRAVNRQSEALVHDAFGPAAEVLRVERRDPPVPGPGALLVEMIATPINPSDLLAIAGVYGPDIVLPAVPGFEGVGRVVAQGPGVAGPAPGSRVLALRGGGTWARHVAIPAATAVPVPDEISDDLAAQLWINPMTVWLLLTAELRIRPGDVVLANAAGSGFGRALCGLGRHLGAEIVAITRSDALHDALLAAGAAAVIDETRVDLPTAVRRLAAGRPVRAALDAVGGASGSALAACLPRGGSLRWYARLSGEAPRIDPDAGIDAAGFWLRRWVRDVPPAEWHARFAELFAAVTACGLRLPVQARHPLREAAAAVAAAAARDKPGKILFAPAL